MTKIEQAQFNKDTILDSMKYLLIATLKHRKAVFVEDHPDGRLFNLGIDLAIQEIRNFTMPVEYKFNSRKEAEHD